MIVWIDLETTGLSPSEDCLLEIAVVITDDDLNQIDWYQSVIKPKRRALRRMDDFVTQMHTRSGLLLELADGRAVKAVEAEVIAFLDRHKLDKRITLAGDSVHFDKAFIERHMPELAKRFSHQILDVSSVANCVKRWHASVYWAMEDERDERAGVRHRAFHDILSSIRRLDRYRDEVFVEAGR